jgi:hypothetical protein
MSLARRQLVLVATLFSATVSIERPLGFVILSGAKDLGVRRQRSLAFGSGCQGAGSG